ncbi:MAG: hypothetical protein ABJ000_07715 [Saccharospirillum sp.]|uniref:hypothetical protein n=1 Tax=Saccharospirillum sp. TaxID=2033801 RepID=UPI00329A2E82
MIKEKIFTYGEHQHGIGVVSEPDDTSTSPVVVLLNAGLSHRAEPYRLNVLLARRLAALGYIALRVDLSGKGDSPTRESMSNRESVSLDWTYMKQSLEILYGPRTVLMFGLCSGADNGIKLCAQDPDIKGLILLDPVSRQDPGFARRDLLRKLTNLSKWQNIHKILLRRFKQSTNKESSLLDSPMDLRDEPNDEDMDQCLSGIVKKDGRVLALFTSQTLYHYNKCGQFASAMGIDGLTPVTEEFFWPNAKHIYPVEMHRNRLIETVADWADRHIQHFKSMKPE